MEIIKNDISLLAEDYIKETKISNEVDVIVKDTYPDVESIIDYTLDVENQNIRYDGNRYVISGKACCNILYIADDSEKSVCSVNHVTNFEEGIDLKSNSKEQKVIDEKDINLDINLDYINVTLLNSRKLNVKYVLECKTQVSRNESYEVVSDIESQNEENSGQEESICKKYKNVKLYELSEKIKQKILYKERYQLPSNKPEILEILKIKTNVSDVDFVDNEYEVVMSANINLGILYKSVEEEMIYATINLPIKEIVEGVENFNRDFDYKVNVLEKSVKVTTDNEDERRVLDIEMVLELCMNIYNEYDKNILEDIYDINKNVDIEYKNVSNINQVCKNNNSYNLREIVKLELKDVMQVVDTTANLKVDGVEILNGVTKVYGEIDGKVLCIIANDGNPLQSIKFNIPFTQVIETKGTDVKEEGDNTNSYTLNSNIDSIMTNMLNPEELEMRININFDLKIFNKTNEKVISDLTISEEDIKKDFDGNMRVYISQNDEPLWDILKKYNIRLEDIRILNNDNITQDMIIKRNEKILIM